MKPFITLLFLLLMSTLMLQAQQIDKKKEKEILDSAQLSNQDISNALKLTLKMGVEEGKKTLKKKKRSLFDLGALDQNISSDVIKVVQTLEKLNNADLVDEFEKILKRTAPGIVNTTEPVFDQAINQMSIEDAYRVLMAGDNAATQYLKEHASPQIIAALTPQIEAILLTSGAQSKWDEILTTYNALTGQNVQIDLADSITEKIVRDMFNQIALEEVKVRMNDYLRNSLLLKAVFSLQDAPFPGLMR